MTKRLVVLVLAPLLAFVLTVVVLSWQHNGNTQPYCPTEDSCRADYNGNTHRWEVHETRP